MLDPEYHMEGYWNPMVPELSATDVTDSLVFYQAIGFSVRFRRAGPDFAYIELGHAQLMLEELTDFSWTTAPPKRPFGRGVNFQIEVEEVDNLSRRLTDGGFSLFEDVSESWYSTDDGEEGQLEFLIQDPDGYLIRLVQPLGLRTC